MKRTKERPITEHMGLVYMVARSFQRTTGLPMEELVAEASIGLVKAALQYDPKKGAFSTWAVFRMRVRLTSVLSKAKEKERNETTLEVDDGDGEPIPIEPVCSITPEDLVDFKQRLERCSLDTREMVRIVLESPVEFLALAQAGRIKGKLKRILRERGWTWPRIWDCLDNGFDELREVSMRRE